MHHKFNGLVTKPISDDGFINAPDTLVSSCDGSTPGFINTPNTLVCLCDGSTAVSIGDSYACFFVLRLFLNATGVCLFLLVLWRLVRCLSRLVRSTRSLCDAGAETNQAMTDGRTPLFIASQKGHLEVVRCLCDAGSAPLHYI